MLRITFFLLVLCAVFNSILPATSAYDHEYEVKQNPKTGSTYGKHDYTIDGGEKYSKKKYYKEKGEKHGFNEKEKAYYKEQKKREYERKRSVNPLEYDSPKNEKFGKYEQRPNHYENPSKSKDLNYHDKSGYVKKERHNEQEIVEDQAPVSLHHDIDVNYIGHVDAFASDAEVINMDGPLRNYDKMRYIKNENDLNEKKVKTNFYKNLKEIDLISIPPSNNSALVARYIMHKVDWTAIATLSTNAKMKGSPFVNIISVSDGPLHKGSGVPFFYMTPKDFSSIDLEKDNRCTITATLAQTDFCRDKDLDPESPLCARLILSGKVKKVKSNTEEETFAKNALFSRHPAMESWPADHQWFFAKLKIKQIVLIDHFGGASYISVWDYFDADNV